MKEKQYFNKLISGNIRHVQLLGLVVALGIVFTITNERFFDFANIMNIVRQTSVLAILSIGMTFIIISGGIDLSIGATLALCAIVAGKTLISTNNVVLSFAAAIAVGMTIGLINGILIGKLGISAFIVTLATMSLSRGATLLISNAASMGISNNVYRFLGQSDIFGLPVVLLLLVLIYGVFIIIGNRFVFSRQIYAIGGNKLAARAMGINVTSRIIQTYVVQGILVGIGAIFTMGRLASAPPWLGVNLEFDAITAVVLGGTSLAGGIGGVFGTLIGAFLVGIISNGLGLINISPFINYIVKGLLILIAVTIDVISQYIRDKRLTMAVRKETHENENQMDSRSGVTTERDITRADISMKGVSKIFPGMKALDKVDLHIYRGEIHALMGENGAGKSTLMKILAGEFTKDSGDIYIDGKVVEISHPHIAAELGIAIIHQEFSLVRELSVMQNIFLGKEIGSKIPFIVNKKAMRRETFDLLASVGIDHIDVNTPIKELSVSEQQMIEIAKALKANAWLIIMDEPTSALTNQEKERLFDFIKKLKAKNAAIVYISHRMQEILEICDRITVLRDGKLIGMLKKDEMNESKIIRMMVGHELNNIFEREKHITGEKLLEVRNLTKHGVFEDISFEVRAGEVLGLSGLMGAGRTEIAKCISGLDAYNTGTILINGKEVTLKKPAKAIDMGIVYVPEDRKREGFVPFMSIRENLAMPSYRKISRLGYISKDRECEISDEYTKALGIKTPTQNKNVVELSGGNQQKVSLGKWLAVKPKILILDEPTRGIDVGAKAEIHQIIQELSISGIAIILISSEMPELLGSADRIIVLREGRITATMTHDEADQNKILEYSVPGY